MSISCRYVSTLCVSGNLKTIFWKFYKLQEKLSYTPKKNSGSRNVNDTYSEQKSTTHIFAALTLASIKSEVEEAQSFELLLKSQRTSSRLKGYPL